MDDANKNTSLNFIPLIFKYTFASPRSQNFSLPDSIIHYITKTPSNVKGYRKLIQTCKYFTSKNHIVPIQTISVNRFDRNIGCGWDHRPTWKYLNLSLTKYKMWSTEKLIINKPNIASSVVVPRIYRCDAEILELENQNILFEEYLIFVSSNTIKRLTITDTIIKYKNGGIVPVEIILGKVQSVIKFLYNCQKIDSSSITATTAKNIIKIPHFQTLHKFQFRGIPEAFNFKTFFDFSRLHLLCGGLFSFRNEISDEYKNQLENYITEIINDVEKPSCAPPIIYFPGQNEESKKILQNKNFDFMHDFKSKMAAKRWANGFD